MKIVGFKHCIHYKDNQFQNIELTIETSTKVINMCGIHSVVYVDSDGNVSNAPEQVFRQLELVRSLGAFCEISTDEPMMFNLETTIFWGVPDVDGPHKIVLSYHLLKERFKEEGCDQF